MPGFRLAVLVRLAVDYFPPLEDGAEPLDCEAGVGDADGVSAVHFFGELFLFSQNNDVGIREKFFPKSPDLPDTGFSAMFTVFTGSTAVLSLATGEVLAFGRQIDNDQKSVLMLAREPKAGKNHLDCIQAVCVGDIKDHSAIF